jgi:hypothetical protein
MYAAQTTRWLMAARQTVSSDGDESRRNLGRADEDLAGLSQGILRDIAILIQTELQLLRAEVSEKIALTGLAAALIGIGALLLLATIVLLLQAAIAGLVAYGLAPAPATLVVAVATLVIGAALLWFGVNRLSATNLAPSKTIKQLQKDANIVQKR